MVRSNWDLGFKLELLQAGFDPPKASARSGGLPVRSMRSSLAWSRHMRRILIEKSLVNHSAPKRKVDSAAAHLPPWFSQPHVNLDSLYFNTRLSSIKATTCRAGKERGGSNGSCVGLERKA